MISIVTMLALAGGMLYTAPRLQNRILQRTYVTVALFWCMILGARLALLGI